MGIPASSRLTNYLWMTSIISVIVLLFGILYYLQTEKKERYFNQLYFRQLEEISRSFETNLVRLRSFTRETESFVRKRFDQKIDEFDTVIQQGQQQIDKPPGVSPPRPANAPDQSEQPDPVAAYQSLVDSQFRLKNYNAGMTRTALVRSVEADVLRLYREISNDPDKVFDEDFVQAMTCPREDASIRHVDDTLSRQYCAALGAVVALLEKLPEYVTMKADRINSKTIGLVKKNIENIEPVQQSAPSISFDQAAGDIKKRNDVVSLLESMLTQGVETTESKKTYGEFRWRFGILRDSFMTDALEEALDRHYQNEICERDCTITPENIAPVLFSTEMERQNREIAAAQAKLVIKQFAENISPLTDDLTKFTAAAETVQRINKSQSKASYAEKGIKAAVDRIGEARREKTILEVQKRQYLAESGPVEASVLRHGLGLKYHHSADDKIIEQCSSRAAIEGALYIASSSRANPYPVSNKIVTSCLSDGYAFTAPMENLLPEDMGQFNAVLITTEHGHVIIQNNSLRNLGNQHFLGIRDLLVKARRAAEDDDPDNAACKEEDGKCSQQEADHSLEHSAFVNETIGGIPFRLYIRPHTVGQVSIFYENSAEPRNKLYFVGIKPLAELRSNKLKISPGISMALFAVVVAIVLVFVFLKIGLAHVDASFTRADGLMAALAVVVFVSLATIGIVTVGVWEKLNDGVENDARETIRLTQTRFRQEVQSYIKFLDYLLSNKEVLQSLVEKQDESLTCDGEQAPAQLMQAGVKRSRRPKTEITDLLAILPGFDVAERLISYKPVFETRDRLKNVKHDCAPYIAERMNRPPVVGLFDTNPVSPLENLFMLDNKGKITGELIRGTRNLVSFPPKDLSGRRYFRSAHAGDVWEMRFECNEHAMPTLCTKHAKDEVVFPVVMERIFNILDGVRNTQFAIPVRHQVQRDYTRNNNARRFDAKTLYHYSSTDTDVISFGVSLHTFKTPILPNGLQFAVVDNADGQVLYHSNDNRSLIENFLQEVENNPHLESLIRTSHGIDRANARTTEDIETFTGLYRGEDTVFFASRLHNDIPWTLILFKGVEDEQLLVTLLFSIAVIIALATLIVSGLIMFVLRLRFPALMNWLWPHIQKSQAYPVVAGWSIGLLVLLVYQPFGKPDDLLLLIMLITAMIIGVVATVYVFMSRVTQDTACSAPELGKHRQRYIMMILSLLLLTTVLPSFVISERVSAELLARASVYNLIKLNEAKKAAQVEIDGRITRLCGDMASRRGEKLGCASVDDSLLLELKRFVHTLSAVGCGKDQPGMFCLTKASLSDIREPGVKTEQDVKNINTLLSWLDNVWDLPALLVALDYVSELRFELNDGKFYQLGLKYPRVDSLLLERNWIALLVVLSLIIAYTAIRFLAVRLLGINVPRSYRAVYSRLNRRNWNDFVAGALPYQRANQFDYGELFDLLQQDTPHYGILIRPTVRDLSQHLVEMDKRGVMKGIDLVALDVLQFAGSDQVRAELGKKLEAIGANRGVLVLENIESIAFDKEKRNLVLALLEAQVNTPTGLSVLILCDVAPLYMLTQQFQYIPESMQSEFADAQEIIRWTRLLFRFEKHYDWSPMELEFSDDDPWENLVLRELSAWPELYALKPDLDRLKEEGKTMECAIQYIATHAGPLYRRRWGFCTKSEKLLLYQLAKGLLINPKNVEPLEHLMRRGFVRRDPGWSIVSHSFARFVLTAEPESVYNEWVTASEQGLWKILRIPLFAVVIVIVGILMYSAQEATETFLALATSVLALLPLLLRNVGQDSTVVNALQEDSL